MQLPKRKSTPSPNASHPDAVEYLTPEGLEKLKRTIKHIERDLPQATEDVSVAVAKGDLSENAEYHAARGRLTSMQNRILSLKERLKRVEIIQPSESDEVQIGSTVVVESDGKEKTYRIVGPRETDPAAGVISYLSPIGAALMKHRVGDEVGYEVHGKEKVVKIVKIG